MHIFSTTTNLAVNRSTAQPLANLGSLSSLAMYPMPVSVEEKPVFSSTTPEVVHHSLNSRNGALVWCGASSSARDGYRCFMTWHGWWILPRGREENNEWEEEIKGLMLSAHSG